MNKTHFQKTPVRQGKNMYFLHFTGEEMEAESCGSCGSVKCDPRTQSLSQDCPFTQARGTSFLSFGRLGSGPSQTPSLPKCQQPAAPWGHDARVLEPHISLTFRSQSALSSVCMGLLTGACT